MEDYSVDGINDTPVLDGRGGLPLILNKNCSSLTCTLQLVLLLCNQFKYKWIHY